MAAESGCVDLVTEMFEDRGARDLLHRDLGRWVEECVNLQNNQLSIHVMRVDGD
jgi:hypothetical protein